MRKSLVVFLGLVLLSGCAPASSQLMKGSTSGNRPKQIFEGVILAPLPPDIVDLQVGADTWQGYNFAMRFRASTDTINKILTQGYTSEPCDAKTMGNGKFQFSPEWNPPMKTCFVWNNAITAWSYNATHHAAVDFNTSEIYIVGVGA